ncbi:MAG: ferrous iron transporter B [Phycisphaerales bacterium]|nr:ferrous iron transporter B [Phycisphaerales bacterium]
MTSGVASAPPAMRTIVLLGNPNVGKTTLFNQLAGVRHKTSNFPGTTQEAHIGKLAGAETTRLIDLPGIYSLELEQSEARVCRAVLDGALAPQGERPTKPDALLIIVNATNLGRCVRLVGEAARREIPIAVAMNMADVARKRDVRPDPDGLAKALGCPVTLVSGRTGEGVGQLVASLSRASLVAPPAEDVAFDRWCDEAFLAGMTPHTHATPDRLTDRLDHVLTHPVLGLLAFALVMTGLFWVVFRVAAYPMDWIDHVFAWLANLVHWLMPPGILQDMLANGAVAGVGATVIFVPQICLLFFLVSLLEDTGYLARGALVIDRWMRPFGLSGHSFVPFLSAHACALPAIMAARAVPDRRERLATILAAPFMSCTARIPVYVLLTVVLFPASPARQAIAFTGAYVLGIVAGLLSALVARRTILRGQARAMALELPPYRLPSLRTALLHTWDRGSVFLRKAGVVILGISIVLWWLGAYPVVDPPMEAQALRAQAALLPMDGPELQADADRLEIQHAARSTFLGRIGGVVEPVLRPIGCDRQLAIGVLASFAAREVFVSTMAVQVLGNESADDQSVIAALRHARRDDGSRLFDRPTSWALLVYYVLAMQCLPTLAVTAREAGGWKWAGIQLAWMSGLAYVAATAVHMLVRTIGA